jgi:N utilization substance protein A
MSSELLHALDQLQKEKGLDKEVLIEAIEAALTSAYKKNFENTQNVAARIDRETGDIKAFLQKRVVEIVENPEIEISLEDANKTGGEYLPDDLFETEIKEIRAFGRIAAQTAKQVVVQRIREAERSNIFEEFSEKEGDIVTGIIQRAEKSNVIIDLGKAEAVILTSEQTPGEQYNFNDRIKCFIVEVRRTNKGPQIMLSRTHPGLVKRLFELEVPEIHEGIVEIKSISREPGSRTKISVFSRDPDIDPVGACVGHKGTRVQAIVDELRGEKIDIIKWSSNIEEFISSSLSPAKVVRVDIDEDEKRAKVTVPDFQLSLAIGKEGQNARLAAKLTGWKIDIKSESQLRAILEQSFLNTAVEQIDDEEFLDDYELSIRQKLKEKNEPAVEASEKAPEAEIVSEPEKPAKPKAKPRAKKKTAEDDGK